MALLVPNVGEDEMLERIVNGTDKLNLHLYSDEITPVEASTTASFTECTGSGYALKALTATWTVAGDPTEASYAQQSFDFTGSQTVHGYYLTNSGNSILMWAEKFTDGPYNIPSGGGSVKITPKIQLD